MTLHWKMFWMISTVPPFTVVEDEFVGIDTTAGKCAGQISHASHE